MIKTLSGIKFETIAKAFDNAFSDYEVQITKEELKKMLKRRGFVPELSFAAFSEGEIIAFTLNGIGNFRGMKTAYDTSTGTTKEFRGQGLASRIFKHTIPYLQNAGVKQYLLEVLQNNSKAKSIYEKLGFEICREFNYFVHNANKVKFTKQTAPEIQIQQTLDYNEQLMNSFWDFEPSWQNSFDSILRKPKDFTLLIATKTDTVVGYLVLEPSLGDVTQIAVDKNYRRQGIASALMTEAIRLNRHRNIKVINADTKCDSITRFLESNSMNVSGKQYEMLLNL